MPTRPDLKWERVSARLPWCIEQTTQAYAVGVAGCLSQICVVGGSGGLTATFRESDESGQVVKEVSAPAGTSVVAGPLRFSGGLHVTMSASGSGESVCATGTPGATLVASTPAVAAWSVEIEGSPTDLVGKALHRTSADTILFGCENNGATYRSVDNGHTFSLMQNLGAGVRVTQIMQLASGTVIAFVRTNSTTWRSTDDGQTWTAGVGPTGTYPREDASVQLAGGRIVSGCHNGHVFTSDDDGVTWTDRGLVGASALVVYSMEVAANGNVVAGTNEAAGGQVYYSTDSGVTWNLATQPATKLGSVMSICLLTNGDLLATGGTTNSVWKSSDHGVTWTELVLGLPVGGGLNLAIYRIPSTGTLLTFGTAEVGYVQVRRSLDDGATWTPAQNDSSDSVANANAQRLITTGSENGREFVQTADGAILACITGSEPVWRSDDDGDTWVNPTT